MEWYYYRIKNLNSTCDLTLQNQGPCRLGQLVFQGNYPLQNQGHSLSPSLTTTESRPDRSKEKWSYGNDITTESRTWILHLIYLYKIKTHAGWGNWCFRGTILYRIKGIPSHHISPLQNQDLIGPKKNGLMEMILLQIQEPEFYMWLISTKSRPMQVGATGVSGELSFTESRALPLTISHHYRIKIWSSDIKGQTLLQNQRP